jgi:hypothetical protein
MWDRSATPSLLRPLSHVPVASALQERRKRESCENGAAYTGPLWATSRRCVLPTSSIYLSSSSSVSTHRERERGERERETCIHTHRHRYRHVHIQTHIHATPALLLRGRHENRGEGAQSHRQSDACAHTRTYTLHEAATDGHTQTDKLKESKVCVRESACASLSVFACLCVFDHASMYVCLCMYVCMYVCV